MLKEIYEIFLSSTSKDLQDYREKVREMIERLRLTSIRMETFGAKPTKPLKTCQAQVANCDALIVIVGNRYGWVPSVAEGGDGTKSITWWEVTWALDAGKPVYAFMCDEKAALDLESEQDRLLQANDDAAVLEIGNAVRNLKKFRAFLESNTTRELFVGVDDLAVKVTTSLHDWILELAVEQARKGMGKETQTLIPAAANMAANSGTGELNNFEQVYWQEQVHLFSARCLPLKGPDVSIALIAGKANLNHPAFAGNADIRQLDLRAQKNEHTPPDDYTTAMAALLVGNDKNGTGYKGVLPGAKLSIFQVLSSISTSTQSELLAAMKAAIIEGNKVICLPLGSNSPSPIELETHKMAAEKGVLVVCPAGNDSGEFKSYPAAYGYGISVAATDLYNRLNSFSNFGDWVHTAAPGMAIPVAKADNSYDKWSGTSFSCGIVAGIVALMLKANGKLTLDQVKALLQSTGQEVIHPDEKKDKHGLRLVDAFQAVAKSLNATHKKVPAAKKAAAKKTVARSKTARKASTPKS